MKVASSTDMNRKTSNGVPWILRTNLALKSQPQKLSPGFSDSEELTNIYVLKFPAGVVNKQQRGTL